MAHEAHVGTLARAGLQCQQREGEARRGPEAGETEAVDEHEPLEALAMFDGVAGADRPAEHMAQQDRLAIARLADERIQPREDASLVQGLSTGPRSAVRGQVRGDHAPATHQPRDDAQPLGGELPRAVEQQQRWPLPALQHPSRDPRRSDASIGDGQSLEQVRTRLGPHLCNRSFVVCDEHDLGLQRVVCSRP